MVNGNSPDVSVPKPTDTQRTQPITSGSEQTSPSGIGIQKPIQPMSSTPPSQAFEMLAALHPTPEHIKVKLPLTPEEKIAATDGILANFQPTSGLEIYRDSGSEVWIDPPNTLSDVTDKNIGGLGITDRDMQQMGELISPLKKYLEQEHGKVLVLGSGFSTLPTVLGEMHRSGQLAEVPVIVDLFDYQKAYNDLVLLQQQFEHAGLEYPLSEQLMKLRGIVGVIESGDVKAVLYKIGSGTLPPELMDVSLAINVIGPASRTILEQISTLAPGGTLLTTEDQSTKLIPNDGEFDVQKLITDNGRTTYAIITRKQ